MKKYPCEEVTYEFEFNNRKIRLWFDSDIYNNEIALIERIKDKIWIPQLWTLSLKEMAHNIASLLAEYKVNAVQVIHSAYNFGYMVYTVPFEDKDAKAI
jgi:hypothetical protein